MSVPLYAFVDLSAAILRGVFYRHVWLCPRREIATVRDIVANGESRALLSLRRAVVIYSDIHASHRHINADPVSPARRGVARGVLIFPCPASLFIKRVLTRDTYIRPASTYQPRRRATRSRVR